MNWYLAVLKNYAGFSGRARRTEYWMFVLVNFVIELVLSIIRTASGSSIILIISSIYALAILIPGIAVGVRRLHDTDRSGGWIFIGLIPLVGAIVLIVFFATAGTQGANRFGEDPKRAEFVGNQPNYQG